jgi:hypothetical protein
VTLAQINAKIQQQQPYVELVKGNGYLYFIYDKTTDGVLVWETESVMVPFLNNLKATEWISRGVEFGQKF